MSKDLLIELGTEELPPKALKKLSDAFTQGVVDGLSEAGFEIGDVQSYAAPTHNPIVMLSAKGQT